MKKCKTVPALFLASIFVLASFFVNNGHASDMSVAVLDMQKVLASSEAGKVAQQAMEQKMKELQDKFKKDEDALLALQEEIEKKSSVWSEEKKQNKAIEFQKMRRDLRVKQDDANLELKQLQEKQLGPIIKELEKVVDKVAKEKGYSLILPKTAVVYASDSIDISGEVTQALNEMTKK